MPERHSKRASTRWEILKGLPRERHDDEYQYGRDGAVVNGLPACRDGQATCVYFYKTRLKRKLRGIGDCEEMQIYKIATAAIRRETGCDQGVPTGRS